MNAETATRRVTEEANIDRMVETGMVIASDGITRRAYICAVCGQQHGAHQAAGATAADRRVGNCDLCGTHSHLLYPVSCWGGLRGASGMVAVSSDSEPTHYGMADAARTATAGHSTQQAARSCDESAKPGTDNVEQKNQAQGKEIHPFPGLSSCMMTAARLVQISIEIIGYWEMLPEAILCRRTACDIATTLLAVAEKLEQSAYAIES